MGYNPFRWYTKGKYRTKPLKSNAPLLLKIRNGDFESSPYLKEAQDEEQNYQNKFNKFMESSQIVDEKLLEKGLEEEQSRLRELKLRLKDEFGKCLWEKSQLRQRGKGTTEDLYWWYKKQVGMGTTPSELAIRLGRKTTKGLH